MGEIFLGAADRNRESLWKTMTTEIILGEPIEVSVDVTKKAISTMKNTKASGPGGISPELISNATENLFRMTTDLFNICLKGEIVPEDEK